MPRGSAVGQHVLSVIPGKAKGGGTLDAAFAGSARDTVLASLTVNVVDAPSATAAPTPAATSTPRPATPPPVTPPPATPTPPATAPTPPPVTPPPATPTPPATAPTPPPATPPPATPPPPATTPAPPATPTLTFDAECGGSGVDPRFKALFGPGDPGDRLDTDTMGDLRQVSVQNGMCTINVERKTTPSGRPFAGAAMATYGTFGQKYGTFETRLRYAEAKGTWPSFFLLPVGQKGPYPEIDVFEAYGDTACEGPGFLTSSLSTSSTVNKWKAWIPVSAPSDGWHVHKIVWTASKIEFYIDDVMTFSSTTVISQVAMYPILIFGVGANNPGCRADATTPSKLTMDVDYLRVYAP